MLASDRKFRTQRLMHWIISECILLYQQMELILHLNAPPNMCYAAFHLLCFTTLAWRSGRTVLYERNFRFISPLTIWSLDFALCVAVFVVVGAVDVVAVHLSTFIHYNNLN